MKIKLIGELDLDLRLIGLESGDIIKDATPDPISKVGSVNFTIYYNGFRMDCVVWPVNYEIISEK